MKAAVRISITYNISIKEAKLRLNRQTYGAPRRQSAAATDLLEAVTSHSKELQLIHTEVGTLKQNVSALEGVSIPAIEFQINTIEQKIGDLEINTKILESSINSRLEGFGKAQKAMETNLTNRFEGLQKSITYSITLSPFSEVRKLRQLTKRRTNKRISAACSQQKTTACAKKVARVTREASQGHTESRQSRRGKRHLARPCCLVPEKILRTKPHRPLLAIQWNAPGLIKARLDEFRHHLRL